MKKFILSIIIALIAVSASAQVPYFAGTVGHKKVYGYHSVKFRPGVNMQETYTTFQVGIGNRFAVGTDMYTGVGSNYIGYTARVNAISSDYYNLGFQVTPSFSLHNSHKYSYTTAAMYMNGYFHKDLDLMWVSNTWFGINDGSPNTLDQWWYLGYYWDIGNNSGITPMVGCIHSWLFDTHADLAVGAYFTHDKFNFYLWGDKFFNGHPRIVLGVDFTFEFRGRK